MIDIRQGDALTVLRTMPSDSVHCVVTSPPYHGLRRYIDDDAPEKPFEIGVEATPELWCARLVEVFREVRRVLRSDGIMFVNCGDSYAASTKGAGGKGKQYTNRGSIFEDRRSAIPLGIKPKDLIGAPWMLAFALRADGWWLRGDYIWSKPNPMPESVRDRCTKSHEYIFHFSKADRYFFDAEAVREPHIGPFHAPGNKNVVQIKGNRDPGLEPDRVWGNSAGRNLRSVWTIVTDPLPSIEVDGEKLDHFASFPAELARRAILAGTSAKGCCPDCGAPWARVLEPGTPLVNGERNRGGRVDGFTTPAGGAVEWAQHRPPTTTGWHPTCSCVAWDYNEGVAVAKCEPQPIPCRVLDPFFGSGRTGLACDELGRDCIGIELNPASVRLATAQIERARARRMIGGVSGRATVPDGQLRLEL